MNELTTTTAQALIKEGYCAIIEPYISSLDCAAKSKDTYRKAIKRFFEWLAAKKEAKSRRLQLLVKPSIHDAIKERAEQSGTSVNDWINGVLERALGTGEAVTLEEVLRQYKSGDK